MGEDQEKKIKFEHFHNLIAVAYADGYLDQSEIDFLLEKAEEIGLPLNKVNQLMDKAENLEFIIPLNTEESENQLADAVFMMMIDGEIHDKEYNICLQMAERLGLSKSYLDHVVELTKKLWKNK